LSGTIIFGHAHLDSRTDSRALRAEYCIVGIPYNTASLAALSYYCTDPNVSCGDGWGCPVVVHYWADLQSVHGFRCYDNIAPNAKCQRVFVLALSLIKRID